MSTTVLDTFIAKFGFKSDDKGLAPAKKGLSDIKGMALKVGAVFGAVLGGGYLLNSIANNADEMLKFADSIGVAIGEVDALGFAAKRQGGTTEGLRGSLERINKTIGEVERGQGMARVAFEDYGISVKKANGETKTADEMFMSLNQKFATLSTAQQFDLAKKIGIDKGTIRLLQTAPNVVHDLISEAKDLGVLNRKDAEAAADFNDGLTNMAQAFDKVKYSVGAMLFKPLSALFKAIAKGTAFIREHSRFIKILGLMISPLVAYFIALKIAAVAAWIASLGPIALVVAGIALVGAAIALLIDDFIGFFKGQDSYIGSLVEKWPWLGDAIYAIRDVVLEVWGVIKSIFSLWLDAQILLWSSAWKLLTFLWDSGPKVFDAIGEGIQSVIGFIVNLVEWFDKAYEKIKSFLSIGDKLGKLKSFFGFGNETGKPKDSPGLEDGKTTMETSLQPPQSVANAQSTTYAPVSKSNNLTVKEIKVDATGGDSKEIAANVGEALKSQFQNTVQDFDSSIAK